MRGFWESLAELILGALGPIWHLKNQQFNIFRVAAVGKHLMISDGLRWSPMISHDKWMDTWLLLEHICAPGLEPRRRKARGIFFVFFPFAPATLLLTDLLLAPPFDMLYGVYLFKK